MHVYLDNNATTKPLDGAVEAMLPFLGSEYANPSSVHRFGQRVRHVITSAVEHSAVHRLATQLAREGYRVDRIGVDHQGRLGYDELEDRVAPDTALISIVQANIGFERLQAEALRPRLSPIRRAEPTCGYVRIGGEKAWKSRWAHTRLG